MLYFYVLFSPICSDVCAERDNNTEVNKTKDCRILCRLFKERRATETLS